MSVAAAAQARTTDRPPADFNGDGYADMAISAPYEDASLGVVHIVYGGSEFAQHASHNQLIAPSIRQADGRFGEALAWGDFNGDGYDDLAVGAPGGELSGVLFIFVGSATGLPANPTRVLRDPDSVILPYEAFAAELAAGDVNGDGYSDLAVTRNNAGTVYVFSGSAIGISEAPSDVLALGFGYYAPGLAFGDFNADGFDDLAMGLPYHGSASSGIVLVDYGSPFGFSHNAQVWTQGTAGLPGTPEAGDRFGAAFAPADFNADGFTDLAIGAPGQSGNAGVVHVLFGRGDGLTGEQSQLWSQSKYLFLGAAPEPGDEFGSALAAGDFNGDGFAELVVGVPGEDDSRGVVHVLSITFQVQHQLWSQDSPSIEDSSEIGDRFGSAFYTADFAGSGFDALAIGVPVENYAGAVNLIFGGSGGLAATRDRLLMQGQHGIADTPDFGDFFGTLD